MHKLKIIIRKVAQLKFIHYICITKGDNNEGNTWTILLRTAPKKLWCLAMGLGFGKGRKRQFVKDFCTKEEAREYVWKMNGWGQPKTKLN